MALDYKNDEAAIKHLLGNLNKVLRDDLNFTDYFTVLITLQKLASDEKSLVQLRNDVVTVKGSIFVQECAEMWNCSFREAFDFSLETTADSRFSENGHDSLLSLPYAEYLKTAHWRAVRTYALLRADYRCQLCNSSSRLEVHHRTYERKGMEDYRDVIALCHECHAKFHGKEAE